MIPQLYPHQTELIEKVRQSMLRGHKSILVQLATGGGKSFIAAKFIHQALFKGRKAILVVPRRELIKQMDATFEIFDISHSFVAAKYPFNPYSQVHVCSSGTLVSRLSKVLIPTPAFIKAPPVVFIDETHYGGAQLDKIIKHFKRLGYYVIGLSATPWRLDGQGLGMWYSDMVCGPSISWLIKNGFLSDYMPFAPNTPNLAGLRRARGGKGDWIQKDLAAKMEEDRVLIGDTVKYYRDHAIGRLGITFSTSQRHSELIAESYRNAGIPAMAMDSNTPDFERSRIIKAFARRELLQLVNCELLIFGFDLALAAGMDVRVECLSDLQPTQSLSKQMQKWGRGLRKGPASFFFDHAGNFTEHGLPDDERNWTLQGEEKGDGDGRGGVAVKQCHKCHYTHRPAPSCPNCGLIYEVDSREVRHIDGELVELDKDAFREMRAMDPEEMKETMERYINDAMRTQGMPRHRAIQWAAKKITQQTARRRA